MAGLFIVASGTSGDKVTIPLQLAVIHVEPPLGCGSACLPYLIKMADLQHVFTHKYL